MGKVLSSMVVVAFFFVAVSGMAQGVELTKEQFKQQVNEIKTKIREQQKKLRELEKTNNICKDEEVIALKKKARELRTQIKAKIKEKLSQDPVAKACYSEIERLNNEIVKLKEERKACCRKARKVKKKKDKVRK